MGFLAREIREKGMLSAEVEADEFIRENNISENHIIFHLSFDKKTFETDVQVKDWLNSHFYFDSVIFPENGAFVVDTALEAQLDMETEISVEIRPGITARAAELVPVPFCDDVHVCFGNELKEFQLALKPKDIKNLSLGVPHIIELCKVADGMHPNYGRVVITKEDLESMERNFHNGAFGRDLMINKDHQQVEALGWLADVFLSFDGETLLGQIVWNPEGSTALAEKRFRYFSPEINFDFTHHMSQENFGVTLVGGALTNLPFLQLEAITSLNNKNKPGVSEMSTNNQVDLKVHSDMQIDFTKKVTNLELELSNKTNEIAKLTNECKELNTKVTDMEAKAKEATKFAGFTKLFDGGTISKAQLDLLKEGKGMLEVLALNSKEANNTKPNGKDADGNDIVVELDAGEKEICKKLNLTHEEFIAGNKAS